ncbi:NAD(P)/FAD-dependent oxidoreductase [Catellatospora tritici]|uniref:NAD(P)/FAD-dependent oxidoreductase n=1 Tax=Catellatospora tritici TaxID=2851566 RepID=UPI001C2CF333|nr:FAD-dependent oxidoreductase [Catellatospora tritici]MBV1849510.1 FAD-binding oxidoreductase [Catellatospora tritici]MBV1854082.1 FAD-binding oxidoreductase [Catellatospora tritici]
MTVSLWRDTAGGAVAPRPRLSGDLDVDVAIVGAGYTGLWTAYYLRRADPNLRVAIVEAEQAGFGASGRNGGWCSGLLPVSLPKLERRHGRDAAVAFQAAMNTTVDEVGKVAAAEGIDCDFAKGGSLGLARSARQWHEARAEAAQAAAYGFELELLGPAEARARCGATDVHGGTWNPHCAALHPLKLARGLARTIERQGVPIYEKTPALELAPGAVRTAYGTVRARFVVRATEGYTPGLPGSRRAVVPIYSLMVATAPLPDSFWARTGLAARETFTDLRRLVIYGQRTADGRLAFGGRGAPYHFGSAVRPSYDTAPRVHDALRHTLRELFPALDGTEFTHAWGGPLGIARDWHPSVGLDRATGLAWAGGYVGDGVAATNLAGQTLADLITGHETERTALPWVNHRSPNWEPEPLRWLGINAGLRGVVALDALSRLRS